MDATLDRQLSNLHLNEFRKQALIKRAVQSPIRLIEKVDTPDEQNIVLEYSYKDVPFQVAITKRGPRTYVTHAWRPTA
jgi:hypothetical protein